MVLYLKKCFTLCSREKIQDASFIKTFFFLFFILNEKHQLYTVHYLQTPSSVCSVLDELFSLSFNEICLNIY